jgi:hypothetical protein
VGAWLGPACSLLHWSLGAPGAVLAAVLVHYARPIMPEHYITVMCPYKCDDTALCKKGITKAVPAKSHRMIPADIATPIIERMGRHIQHVHGPEEEQAMNYAATAFHNAEIWTWEGTAPPPVAPSSASASSSLTGTKARSRSPHPRQGDLSSTAPSSAENFSMASVRHLSSATLTELIREAQAELNWRRT